MSNTSTLPIVDNKNGAASAADNLVPLVRVDRSLTSLRSSGHDPYSAVGEVIDNSLEANANNVRIQLFSQKKTFGRNKRAAEVVEHIAVGDDGDGMDQTTLHQALQLGFSTRFNSRKGMGRFGVGSKLAAISQAKRVDIYSREKASDPWLWTYIDLDEIESGALTVIPLPKPADIPADCGSLVDGKHSGTLVIWSKTDRLQQRDSGGARSAETVRTDLVNYVARTFRKFLDSGINIQVNEAVIKPHDPLFLMTTTRFHEGDNPDPVAAVIVEESFDWPVPSDPDIESRVEVTMTLLPEGFRPEQGAGGSKENRERRIDENEGVSILRANREIFHGTLRNVQPSVKEIDRWIGIEIRFSPELDECFAVRNVKKGAEPINGLRDKLKDIIYKTVGTGRKQVQTHWQNRQDNQATETGAHSEAESIAAQTANTAPKPIAGQDVDETERKKKIRAAAKSLTKENPENEDAVADKIETRPVTIVAESFPGNELFEIEHLGSNAIVKLNSRHPFFTKVYGRLLEETKTGNGSADADGEPTLAKLLLVGLDLFICAYAMAEGMDSDPVGRYSDLRSYWGIHLKNMINAWK